MINRFRQVVTNVMVNAQQMQGNAAASGRDDLDDPGDGGLPTKYNYNRPEFLQLTPEEITIASDCTMRPIMVPRDLSKLPWYSGYAEVVNAGKSKSNEDQSAASHFVLKGHDQAHDHDKPVEGLEGTGRPEIGEHDDIPMTYFAIFDGHAGTGSSLMAVNNLHYNILDKLDSVYELLIHSTSEQRLFSKKGDRRPHKWPFNEKNISVESLITGALETAFLEIDSQLGREKTQYHVSGGCTALIALFIMGKLYVSNAGDSRAILVKGKDHIAMSTDFTPVLERQRMQILAELHPQLLSDEFTHLEFQKRVQRKDLGKRLMYRDGNMIGWAYKEVTENDLKFPLVYGEGKRARVLATIGVTRGFGDHELKVHGTDIHIKPFLTPAPEVKIYNLFDYDHSENDVLVMGSDGLWDILSSERVAEIVHEVLESFPPGDYKRYASAAQELAMSARGVLKENGWRTKESKPGSGDDITVFVIPLCHHTPLSPQNSLTESNQAVPYIDSDDL